MLIQHCSWMLAWRRTSGSEAYRCTMQKGARNLAATPLCHQQANITRCAQGWHALYICYNRYSEGAEQFRRDVAVNPNDTEEAIWACMCEAQTLGLEEARKRLLRVGRDPRPYMRQAYG